MTTNRRPLNSHSSVLNIQMHLSATALTTACYTVFHIYIRCTRIREEERMEGRKRRRKTKNLFSLRSRVQKEEEEEEAIDKISLPAAHAVYRHSSSPPFSSSNSSSFLLLYNKYSTTAAVCYYIYRCALSHYYLPFFGHFID